MNEEWLDRYEDALLPVFGRPALTLARGKGARVWDVDGDEYLDLYAGIAVNALGHAHPDLVSAIARQAAELIHVSNFYATAPEIELAERLLALGDLDGRVFFANSGTEANEAAVKIARRTGRTRMLALDGAFHGRTFGALSLTHNTAYREPFEPLVEAVEFVPFGDTEALARAVASDDVACLIVEPLQGEGGVRPLPDGYLAAAREITAAHGTLLVVDEVQTGIGRTGDWFAFQSASLPAPPDVITLAKGLGGGFPIGAVIAVGDAAGLLARGQHGSTFGGGPLACAAALAVLSVIERDGLIARAAELGERVAARVASLGDDRIQGVRGSGLLLALQFSEPIAAAVASAALSAGFLVNPVTDSALRLAPPLVIEQEELDGFVDALPTLLDASSKE